MSYIHALRRWSIALIGVIALVGSIAVVSATQAVGLSPAFTDGGKLRRDNDVQKIVYISRSNPTKDAYYRLTVNGDGARYIVLDKELIEVPAGKHQVPVQFSIRPESAANGTYTAKLSFVATGGPSGEADDGASVSIVEGVVGQVQFSVTDEEIRSFSIIQVSVDDTEENLPVTFMYDLVNSGNVDARPDRIEVVVTDVTDGTEAYREEISAAQLAFVAPGDRGRNTVTLNGTLPQGMYYLQMSFFAGSELIFSRNNVRLEVFPAGTFARDIAFTSFTSNDTSLSAGSLIRFDAEVRNTGDVVVEPVLFIEIKRGNDVVDLLRSDSRVIRKGGDSTYTMSFRPQQGGNYTASAYFEYGAERTDFQEISFSVDGGASMGLYIGAGILLLIIVIVIIMMMNKKRPQGPAAPQTNNQQPPTAPPQSGTAV